MVDDSEILIRWLRDGLEKPGKTMAGCAHHLGYSSHSSVAKMLSGKPIRAEQLPVIAAYIDEPIPPQFTGRPTFVGLNDPVILVGRIAFGTWRDTALAAAALVIDIPKYAVEPYLSIPQEAFLVEDDSAEPYARRGDYVLTVDYDAAGLRPQDSDPVVAIEERKLEGARLRQIALRQIVERDGRLFLALMSGGSAIPTDGIALRYAIGKSLFNARIPRR
jgi:hypothetical protein